MIKTAIFVEGQTELIFVRELLLKVFQYQNIALDCFTLFTDGKFNTTEYPFSNAGANFYFQIINVGNDASVLSRIVRREQRLWKEGFIRIVGLRDMYSKDYRDAVMNSTINQLVNEQFIKGTRARINSDKVYFCFAIMEVEAWILGLRESFLKLDATLTADYIKTQLGLNLVDNDPEITYFHPAAIVEKVFALANRKYDKSKGEASAILNSIDREDFISLYKSNKCASFKEFCDFLSIGELLV
ncbi:MAG: DUF4276 family protein [Flavobacterium sp.]|nr:DUF4276 family protein [Flavobacterium sp.]